MYVIRPIKASDADAFVQLAFEAGLGLVSIPKNPELLHDLIVASEKSFAKRVETPGDESYLFVLENILDNTLGGVCGIHATTGHSQPIVFFHIEKSKKYNPLLEEEYEMSWLKVVQYRDAPTEICSLFLSRAFRHSGLGRLLSLCRFLFMAAFPQRFHHIVFADMRGVVEDNIDCPFWNGIGRLFLNMNYSALMQMKNTKHFSIIDQLPDGPIYIPLLPQEVQKTIGKVHNNTKPALNMLMQEGFSITDDVSIYDGGPKIEVEMKNIYTVKNSAKTLVSAVNAAQQDDHSFLISNDKLNYRCCFGKITFTDTKEAIISTNVAAALHVDAGDHIRYIHHTERAS